MTTNARTQILDILTRQRASTVEQMSRAIQVTQADIRHHITKLRREGLVEEAGVRSGRGRGRPSKIYRLTAEGREDNLVELGKALLELVRAHAYDPGMNQTATLLAGQAAGRIESVAARRFFLAIQRLNELHYHARWEAHAESPLILLGNCPYANLVDDYPELCQMDAGLLSKLTGLPASQTAKLEATPAGSLQCVFRLAVRQ